LKLRERDLPVCTTLNEYLDASKEVAQSMLKFPHQQLIMLLASLALRYVTQQNGEDPVVVQLKLADRCFCRKLMTILVEGEDFLSLTHEPRRLT
jgi:hypothetical protein